MEFLNKVKKVNSYLLKTWIPAGQDFQDKEIEKMVMEIYGSGKDELAKLQIFEIKYTCNSDKIESMSYNQEKWDAADDITKEVTLNLGMMETMTGEPWSVAKESMTYKWYTEMQAKHGFKDL